MTARVVFGEAPNTTLIVPLNAVTDRGQGAQVWVVEDGKAVPRKVQVAQFSEHGALIDNGLKEGERVIISGLNRLTPGMAVSAKTAAPPERQR
jgi:multidrug efflux pump subunit AcrA (membrane-fusion protein)